MIDIQEAQLALLLIILKEYLPKNTLVYAFGSRTNGTARKFSDLDLIVKTLRPLELETKMALREAFSESDLTFRVDISDWLTLSESFKATIRNELQLVMGNECIQ